MATAFTSAFTYNQKGYTAVITQAEGSVSIYLPDEGLHDILPNGRFTFNPQQGLKIDPPKLSPIQNLVLSILAAVEEQKGSATGINSGGSGQ